MSLVIATSYFQSGVLPWSEILILLTRLAHLDVEDCSEDLLRQQSCAIKNQLGQSKPLVLYGVRAPIIGPFRAWNANYPYAKAKRPILSLDARAGSLWHNG